MRDIRRYWQEVRAIEHSLPEFVWLVSALGNAIVQVYAAHAAPLLHAKSHRLAVEEEIAAHLALEEKKKKEATRDSLRRRGIAIVPIPPKDSPAEASKRATTKRR